MITVVCEDNKEDDKNIQGKKCFIKLTKTSYKKNKHLSVLTNIQNVLD